jgi:NAD(P)-dependent dehydrogenase (short-subunit alcohol dehydrogenase family)
VEATTPRDSANGVLAGYVAVVTGAGRGIGKQIALAYAREGATVIATAARGQHELDACKQQAATLSGRIEPLVADVTVQSDLDRLVDFALDKGGQIDILVNNAARGMRFVSEDFMTKPARFWDADPDAWRLVTDTNINGVFLVTKAIVPLMLKRRSGSIINLTINPETMVREGFSPYGPSKAALEAMTHAWARELEGSGVRINLLLPGGATDTGMIPDTARDKVQSGLLDPEIVVPAAIYLATSSAHDERVTAATFVLPPDAGSQT